MHDIQTGLVRWLLGFSKTYLNFAGYHMIYDLNIINVTTEHWGKQAHKLPKFDSVTYESLSQSQHET